MLKKTVDDFVRYSARMDFLASTCAELLSSANNQI